MRRCGKELYSSRPPVHVNEHFLDNHQEKNKYQNNEFRDTYFFQEFLTINMTLFVDPLDEM